MRILKPRYIWLLLFKFVVFLRIVTPFLIYIDPIWGFVIVFLLDVVDADIASLGVLTKKRYQEIDKALDFWWYTIALIWSFTYLPNYFPFLLGLFLWRSCGTLIFYKRHNRKILLIFANYFESVLLLLILGTFSEKLGFLLVGKDYYLWLGIAVATKLFQEWWIHVAELSVQENLLHRKRNWVGATKKKRQK